MAWKFESHNSDMIVPHDVQGIRNLPSHLMAKYGRGDCPSAAQSLYQRGSEAVSKKGLEAIGYDRAVEARYFASTIVNGDLLTSLSDECDTAALPGTGSE